MLNLSQGECIIVEFDDVTPVREAQSLLVGFCGLLATDRCIFPIGFVKWNDSPESYFNPCFGQIIKISPDQWTSYVDYRLDKKTQMFETGHKPGRAELYLATHKKEDGSHVNEAAKEICISGNSTFPSVDTALSLWLLVRL
ncbi:hypothetical protein FXO37_04691 [Capsicum annuum]|nr:hypothetical protein FXO37_04691 [Capsicum annuum]